MNSALNPLSSIVLSSCLLVFWLESKVDYPSVLGKDTSLCVCRPYPISAVSLFSAHHVNTKYVSIKTISIINNQTVNIAFKSSLANLHQLTYGGQRNKLCPKLCIFILCEYKYAFLN